MDIGKREVVDWFKGGAVNKMTFNQKGEMDVDEFAMHIQDPPLCGLPTHLLKALMAMNVTNHVRLALFSTMSAKNVPHTKEDCWPESYI